MAENKVKTGDERRVLDLTVAELRAIVRDEIEYVLNDSRGVPNPLMTVAELAELLRISERTIATLREDGLPVTWITPDAVRFQRDEVMRWLGEFNAWIAAGRPETAPFTVAWADWLKAGCRGPKPE